MGDPSGPQQFHILPGTGRARTEDADNNVVTILSRVTRARGRGEARAGCGCANTRPAPAPALVMVGSRRHARPRGPAGCRSRVPCRTAAESRVHAGHGPLAERPPLPAPTVTGGADLRAARVDSARVVPAARVNALRDVPAQRVHPVEGAVGAAARVGALQVDPAERANPVEGAVVPAARVNVLRVVSAERAHPVEGAVGAERGV